MAKQSFIQADDLFHISSVSDPQFSPDGNEALFIRTEIDQEKNTYVSNLYHWDRATNEINAWTHGKDRVSGIQWGPNGEHFLFLSTRNEKNQVYLMSKNGGEAKQITEEEKGVNSAIFSPDGKKVIYHVSASKENDQDDDEKKDEKDEKDFPKPKVIERMKYKADGVGLLEESYQQVKLLDIDSEEVNTLLSGHQNFSVMEWMPDGQSFFYVTDEEKDQDFNFNMNLYRYDIESKQSTLIETEEGYVAGLRVSPNGKQLLFVEMGRTYENATHTELYHYDLETGIKTCLTEGLDAPVGDFVVADIQQQPVLQLIVWASDRDFYFPVSTQGNIVLYYGNVDGELYPALQDDFHIYGFDVNGENQQALLTISTPTSPSELYSLDIPTGKLDQVTHFHDAFLEKTTVVEPEAISYTSKDDWTIHGWFMKPAGYEEGKKYPMIVNIHGGPHAFYANTFFHEMQLLAAKGYAVLYVNPRGSHSYSQEFVDAVRGDYGNGDYEDIMNGVDYITNQYDWIDQNRLGVTGGSYGGFMTNWIVGHTNRFKAAVTQRSISNWISFRGVSDIGYYFSDWQIQAEFSDVEKLWKHSPIAYVDQMETPLLIIHNENDFRCPIEQAEQLFIALKYRQQKTKFVRFPEADHNLSRTGKPNLRLERLNHIVGWFDEHLK
ncbi:MULTISPECIES: S9 family peptidase [Allobacillus]|uniref:S9 family peptidase n=1 Tax=Allobacillus salarius TaxID=1955272 RepID=A0A556PSZ3_9BACI|nr:S9 family peptidase [Allobacillus salarius]TSJ67506.1 S9 family peptidase [Allobacillus salarius]